MCDAERRPWGPYVRAPWNGTPVSELRRKNSRLAGGTRNLEQPVVWHSIASVERSRPRRARLRGGGRAGRACKSWRSSQCFPKDAGRISFRVQAQRILRPTAGWAGA